MAKTTDGGRTWKQLKVANVGTTETFRSCFQLDKKTMFVAGQSLYKSTDEGITFKEIGGFVSASSIFNIHFYNSSDGLAIQASTISKTTDGGNTWEDKYTAGWATNMQVISKDMIVVAGGINADGYSVGEMHKSVDGGNTWKEIELTIPDITLFHFINEQTGYFIASDYQYENELYKTIDGGEIWEHIPEDSNLNTGGSDMLFVDENHGYVVGSRILETFDGGRNWSILYNEPGIGLLKIININGTIYCVGGARSNNLDPQHGVVITYFFLTS
jgi:photosystem II stability/assembly factor-like uncharacterized protein